MAQLTPSGTPVPTLGDPPNVPADMLAMAMYLEPVTTPRFASTGTANAGLPSRAIGQGAIINNVPMTWNGTTWVRSGRGLTFYTLATGILPGFGVGIITPGNEAQVYAQNLTIPAQGAYILQFELAIPVVMANSSVCAGFVRLGIGGVNRSYRFHNQAILAGMLPVGGTHSRGNNFAGGSTVAFNASVSLDAPSGQSIGMLEATYTINAIAPEA